MFNIIVERMTLPEIPVPQTELSEHLPLSPPVYHVLLALGQQTLHGYGIMQGFEEMTAGAEQLLAGTLYATLARMVETGFIEETPPPDPAADRRRRYYRVTELGRQIAALEAERMARLVAIARSQQLAPDQAG